MSSNIGCIKAAMIAYFPQNDDDLYKGGVNQASYRLIDGLSEIEGLDLRVLSPSTSINSIETKEHNNATVIFFPAVYKGYDTLLNYMGVRRAIRNILSEIKPDIVHAQGVPSYIRAALDSEFKHVITIHGLYRNEMKVLKSKRTLKDIISQKIMLHMEANNLKRIRNLISITSEITQTINAESPSVRVFRIDNAIDDNYFSLDDTSTSPTVLFIGWINRRKGLHILLPAFKHVLKAMPDAKLRIAGLEEMDPRYAEGLKREHSGLIESGRVMFLGGIPQERLYNEISSCRVFCLPSLSESAPMVIAEAMAAGKPVVASRVGGVPEMVEDGVTGKLFAAGDSDALSDCLISLLSNHERSRQMGAIARKSACERYMKSSVAQMTYNAYKEIACGS